jgi:4-hydroxybutyrate CoA-transferase
MSMMDWKELYKARCKTLDEAVGLIKSGDLIIDGHGCGRSEIFGSALIKRAADLRDVTLCTGFNIGGFPYCAPEFNGTFKHLSVYNTAGTRAAHWEGRASFAPGSFSQLERLTTSWEPDVLFTHVTPPDANGYVSMGISVDFTRNCVDVAKMVIAQVNSKMPWVGGDAIVHVSDIDCFVEQDAALPEIPEAVNLSQTDIAIAKNIASLIADGDTLQVGVGSVPDMVLSLLENHKHLGIHTELASTGVMRLLQKGVVDNSMKSLDAGKVVCTLLGGTDEFYKFVDHNDLFEMRKSSYVLNPAVIAGQRNMVAMNSATQIDLFGQVCAEMIRGKQYSGVGGQLDFLRGAMMAENGRSIICMPSTAGGGKSSRIVARLDAGNVVTDTRYDTMYVVTEFGVADLWGKTNEERARRLINIAHPDFREQLERDYYEKIHKKEDALL